MAGFLTIFNAIAPLVLQGIKGKGAKDQRARIVFAIALMRILACLRQGKVDHKKASKICIQYIVALGPKGTETRHQILEGYKESLEVKEPESGDEEILEAL